MFRVRAVTTGEVAVDKVKDLKQIVARYSTIIERISSWLREKLLLLQFVQATTDE